MSMAGFFLPHLRPGMRVLDCGCGPGSITMGLAAHVAPGEVIGIDLDPTHIALARRRAADAGLANVRFARADIYTLPFPDAAFDAVFCHSILSPRLPPRRADGHAQAWHQSWRMHGQHRPPDVRNRFARPRVQTSGGGGGA